MRRALPAALALDVLGAAGALLVSSRVWQTVTIARPRPLGDDVVDVSGRALDGMGTALALVALAGSVALVATRGAARRLVGGVLVLAGLLLAWRSLRGLGAVSASRGRDLAHSGVGLDPATRVHVTVHAAWPLASLVCALLVVLAGVLAALTGAVATGLDARYDTPSARTSDASLWSALDRGDDPTAP